jgi:uncharacterized protein DUF2846
MKVGRRITSFGILLELLLNGCATVPMAPADADSHAKTFATKPDKSRLYVYRNETFGGAARMTISLDGKVAGQSGPKTFFLWDVEPGPHEITSHAENIDTLTIITEAGKAYYVWQEAKVGIWGARSRMHLMEEEAGRKAVAECQLAQSNF